MFVYGTQFYRPPNPPLGQRRQALERVRRELGFNTIKIWAMWNMTNPGPGIYDFAEIEEIMGACDDLDLKVVVNTILENVPYWLDEQHPDARYVNARGEPLEPRGRSSNPSGGWPGLCLDHPEARAAAADYLTALAGALRSHPSMFCYDCWNEPHLEPAWFNVLWPTPEQTLFCYCPSTVATFRRWLEQKHHSVAALNEAWVRSFRSWDDVRPPRTLGTSADWLDWRRFLIDDMTENMAFRVRTLKAADPDHPVMSHGAVFPPLDPLSLSVVDNAALARQVDRWGASLFPAWRGMTPGGVLAKLDACRSSAGTKEWWLAELQGGHGMDGGLRRSPHVHPNDIRLWNWLAVVAGATGIMYWNYWAEATGFEASGFGLVDRAGELTDRAREAGRMCALLDKYEPLINAYRPSPQVGILYDPDNHLLAFAMDGNEKPAMSSAHGYYHVAWTSDLLARFVWPEEIDSLWPEIKVLMLPWHLVGKPAVLEALRAYVEQGGVVISDTGLSLFDENGVCNGRVPAGGLSQAWGIQEGESYWLPDPSIMAKGEDDLAALRAPHGVDIAPVDDTPGHGKIRVWSPITAEFTGRVYVTPLKVTAPATVIGTAGDTPVAAKVDYGQGTVYYFGTNLGACVHAGEVGALDLLRTILAHHTRPPVTGNRLRPRWIPGEGEGLLVVVNPEVTSCEESLTLPGAYRSAIDVDTGQPVSLTGNVASCNVAGRDVQVLYLQE